MTDWIRLICDVPDFPQPRMVFKDIAPLLAEANAFAAAIAALAAPWRAQRVYAVVAIEARGFILGAPLARTLESGFEPVRKQGKLPVRTLSRSCALGYGQDAPEYRSTRCGPALLALLVDDVLATGGTMAAARDLVECLQEGRGGRSNSSRSADARAGRVVCHCMRHWWPDGIASGSLGPASGPAPAAYSGCHAAEKPRLPFP